MNQPETSPEPVPADIEARIRASFDRRGIMRLLGARLGQIGRGRVHIVLPNRPEISQQHGYIHAEPAARSPTVPAATRP